MTSGDALREVAAIVDALQRGGVEVEDVSVREDGDEPLAEFALRLPGDGLPAELEFDPADGDVGASTADGDPEVEAATAGDAAADSDDGSADDDAAGDDAAGDDAVPGESAASVPCRVESCERTFESAHGMKIHAAKSHDAGDDGSAQPHRNPDRLAEVYEAHETFAEMRDALAADVTAQTVRRNMVKFGVHDPESEPASRFSSAGETGAAGDGTDPTADEGTDATAGGVVDDAEMEAPEAADAEEHGADDAEENGPADAEADAESVRADRDGEQRSGTAGETVTAPDGGCQVAGALDGLAVPEPDELPAGIDGQALVAAVLRAQTLFEFQRALDLDRATAQELLATFDLLELVTGRIGDASSREVPVEEVVHRIEATQDDGPGSGSGAVSAGG